jgi:hypothetical protein
MPCYRIKNENTMNIVNNMDHVLNPHTGQPLKLVRKHTVR